MHLYNEICQFWCPSHISSQCCVDSYFVTSQFIVILLCLDRFTVRQYKYLMSRIIFKEDDIWNISAYCIFTLLLHCAFLFHELLPDSFFFDL